jgi:hypothetical protein
MISSGGSGWMASLTFLFWLLVDIDTVTDLVTGAKEQSPMEVYETPIRHFQVEKLENGRGRRT